MKAIYKSASPYAKDAMNLPVVDVESAIPYYTSIFGMTLTSRSDSPNRAVLSRDSIEIGISENGGDPAQEGCFFLVDSVETAYAELKSNGLTSTAPNYQVQKHGDKKFKVFFVIAPDGLCYCVGETAD